MYISYIIHSFEQIYHHPRILIILPYLCGNNFNITHPHFSATPNSLRRLSNNSSKSPPEHLSLVLHTPTLEAYPTGIPFHLQMKEFDHLLLVGGVVCWRILRLAFFWQPVGKNMLTGQIGNHFPRFRVKIGENSKQL